MTTQAIRYDSIRLDATKARRRADGALIVPARLTRAGVFTYHDASGKAYGELRHPDDVLRPDVVADIGGITVTLGHPREMVTPANSDRYAVGTVDLGTYVDGDHVGGTLIVQRADAIAAIESGKVVEVSLGYWADSVVESGVYDGQAYAYRQRGHRHNHAALVTKGRAGSSARVMLDSAADSAADSASDSDTTQHVDAQGNTLQPCAWMEVLMSDVTIDSNTGSDDEIKTGRGWALLHLDGEDLKMQANTAKLVTDALASRDDKIAALTAELATAKTRVDSASGELDAAKAAADKAKADADERVEAVRKDAEIRARRLGELHADHLTFCKTDAADADDEIAVRKAVINSLKQGFNLDGVSDDYVRGVYTFAVGEAKRAKSGDRKLLQTIDALDSANHNPIAASLLGLATAVKGSK